MIGDINMAAIKLDFSKQRYKVACSDSRFPMFPPRNSPHGFPNAIEAAEYLLRCEEQAKKDKQPWFTFSIVDTLKKGK